MSTLLAIFAYVLVVNIHFKRYNKLKQKESDMLMTKNNKILANNLHKHMQMKNITQVELSEDLGFAQSTISDWLNEKKYPRIDALQKLADYFGVYKSDLSEDKSDQSIYGNHNDNLEYFADKPELLAIYKEIHDSESLQLLFDNAKDLSPQDLETVLMIIKGIKAERNNN